MAEIFMELTIFQATHHIEAFLNWLKWEKHPRIPNMVKTFVMEIDSNDEKSHIKVFVALFVVLVVAAYPAGVPKVHQEYSALSHVGLDEVGCVPGVLEKVLGVPRLSWVSPCFSRLRLCLPPASGNTFRPFLFIAELENELPRIKEEGPFEMTTKNSSNVNSFQNE